ncbi:MAG: DEAD/DEAH box helicase [Bacilli bacterium]
MEIALRDYQQEAVAAFFDGAQHARRQLIALPTGAGKTVIAAAIAKRWHEDVDPMRPILFLAHREELLNQTADKMRLVWDGVGIGKVKAQHNEQNADVIVASTATLARGRFVRDPSLIIYDEAHHAGADGALNFLRRLGVFEADGPPMLGLTATPMRGTGAQLGDVFERVAYEKTILDLIVAGYLVDIKGKRVEIPGLDLTRVRTVAGDYNQRDLGQAMNDLAALDAVVEAAKEHAPERKTLVFAVDVAQTHALVKRFKAAKIAADGIDGTLGDEERAAILERFRRGKTKVLVNCMVLTEGFDEPSVSCILIARPTRSRVLYTQMVGRATRLYPGKNDALILDMTGASDDKSLVTFARLFRTPRKRTESAADEGSAEPEPKDGESVLQWKARAEDEEQASQGRERAKIEQAEKIVRDINLFANRSKYRWSQVKEAFAIDYGGDRWAYLLSENGLWWPVIEWQGGKLLPLYDRPIDIAYAQGIAEGFLAGLEDSAKIIEKEADWRNGPVTPRQKHILDLYHIAYDDTWTKGMASDELAKRFAKRRVKDTLAKFDPQKWRDAWAVPERKAQFERLLTSLRRPEGEQMDARDREAVR